jgi:macrolide-specific efflux system membrane fusion protein
MVRVLDDKGQPQPRKVTVGINNGASAEILSGLKEGERVVVAKPAAGAAGGGNRGGMQMRVGGPGMGRR